MWHDGRVQWFCVPGFLFGLLVVLVDGGLRHTTLSAFTPIEKQQYAVSAVGCLAFWHALGATISWFSSKESSLRRPATALAVVAGFTLLVGPYLVWLNLGRFPSLEMVVFLANEGSFVSRMWSSYFHWREAIAVSLGLASLWALARWAGRQKVHGGGAVLALVSLLAVVVTMAVSTVAPSHPFTPEQNALRLILLLAEWGGRPPTFFSLSPRLLPPVRPGARTGQPRFNVLFILGETFGAQYMENTSGRSAAPALKAIWAEPRVAALRDLHSNSTCTDVSIPSLLSGLSPFSTLRELQLSWLPFDEAASRGASTFVASSHRLDWARLEDFLGRERFDRFVDARDYASNAEVDGNIPDAWAYARALEFMASAHHSGRRFAGLVHVNTLHGPYWFDPANAPFADNAGFKGAPDVNYLNAMVHFDKQLGSFWQALAREPFFEDTLIVFTADHGEAFGQHGLFSHCNSFYPEETHVPGFIRLPQEKQALLGALTRAGNAFATNADLVPTLYEIMEWPVPAQAAAWAGHSLLAARKHDVEVFSNCSQVRQCTSADWGFARDGLRWVYSGTTNAWSAFDIVTDPAASHDVASDHRPELDAALPAFAGMLNDARLLPESETR